MYDDNETQIQEIEISLEQAKHTVALGDAYARLKANPDFRLLIQEEYCVQEASRLTMLTAERNFDEKRKQDVLAAIRGIGEFRQFLMLMEMQADLARDAVRDAERAIAEIENGLEPDQEG